MKKLIELYFDGVFCGWGDPQYEEFFKLQGYDIVGTWENLAKR